MWTLVIIVFLSDPTGGGVSTSISSISFQSQQACKNAANVVGRPVTNMQPGENVAIYQVLATCSSQN